MKTTYQELEAKYAALAAENVGLKSAISCHAAGFTVCEACGEENISGNDDVCRALNETPATDRFVAEMKADEAKPLISALKVIANSEQHKGDTVVCDFDTLISVAASALRDYYAKQLREVGQ